MSNQPPPIPNDGQAVWDAVIERMRTRDTVGLGTYHVRLTAFNGRDALTDLLDEQLDACAYTMQAIQERDALRAEVVRLRAENKRLADDVQEWYAAHRSRLTR